MSSLEPPTPEPSPGWPFDLGLVSDVEWGMQLAVRYDKQRLPTHLEVCAASARAVVCLLSDPRSQGDGPWAAHVQRWRHGRIRKLVRRARGIRWEQAQELPGITVGDGPGQRAQVRAFVPAPVRPLPPEIDKLQVSGTNFPRESESPESPEPPEPAAGALTESAASAPAEPDPPALAEPVVTIALTPHATLSTGKAAAQCGHAAQLAWEALSRTDPATTARWLADDARVRVIEPDARTWRRLAKVPIRVVDAGLTEVSGPTESARAWW